MTAHLVLIELRKLVDTRGGVALVAVPLLLSILAAVAAATVQDPGVVSTSSIFVLATALYNVSVPVVAIVMQTQEWTTRSAMITFALTPQRGRVLVAKVLAAVVVAVASVTVTLVVSVAAAVVRSAATGGQLAYRELSGQDGVLPVLASILLYLMLGAALGSALASTAVAVAAFLALTAFGDPVLGAVLGPAAPWFRLADAVEAVSRLDFSVASPAQVSVALLAWIVGPLVLGAWRFGVREAK